MQTSKQGSYALCTSKLTIVNEAGPLEGGYVR